jgi:hypothetical protein
LDSHNLVFDNDKLFINGNSGNIGIGILNPVDKLNIAGNIQLEKNNYIKFKTYGSYVKRFLNFKEIDSDGNETGINSSIGMKGQRMVIDLDYDNNAN